MADRYTYLPLLGIFIALAWGAEEFLARNRIGRIALPIAASALLLTAAVLTRVQVGTWHDSVTLFQHAVDVTQCNCGAQANLGAALRFQGQNDAAMPHLREALRLCPDHVHAHRNLGVILNQQGRFAEAIDHFRAALASTPDNASTHYHLGFALERCGRLEEAAVHYRRAIALTPGAPGAYQRLAWILATGPRPQPREAAEAVHLAEMASRMCRGANPEAIDTLAVAYAAAGRFPEAVETVEKGISLARAAGAGHFARQAGPAAWRAAIRIHLVRIVARCCAEHVVVTRLAAGLAQERRYPAIRRDRSCRDWIGLFCARG